MAKYPVKGAGDVGDGNNPKVTSKFDRMHGQPRTPGKVSHPGGTASPTSNHSSGAEVGKYGLESGHMQPRKVGHHGNFGHEHFPAEDLGTNMADGHRSAGTKNKSQTDALDRPSYLKGK